MHYWKEQKTRMNRKQALKKREKNQGRLNKTVEVSLNTISQEKNPLSAPKREKYFRI